MPWTPLPRIAFAICVFPYQTSAPADLPLQIGDELYIIEQGGKNGSWFRGYLVAAPSLLAGLTSGKGQALEARVFSGIFPRVCVEVRELLGEVPRHAPENVYASVGDANQRSTLSDNIDQDILDAVRISGEWPAPPKGIATPAQQDSHTASEPGPKRGATDGEPTQPENREDSHRAEEDPASRKRQKPPAPVPMLKVGDDKISKDEPLVDEIASCLREWHSTNLHELLLSQNYKSTGRLSSLVDRLDSARRQLLHKILTRQELTALRESAVWDLVNGNKHLNGEVIVRSADKKGRILTYDDRITDTSRLQAAMSLLEERPKPAVDPSDLHHLLVDVSNLAREVQTPASFAVSVYLKPNASAPKLISEVFLVDVTPMHDLTAAGPPPRKRTFFTDLDLSDIEEVASADSQVYLILKLITKEPLRDYDTRPEDTASPGDSADGNLNGTWKGSPFSLGRRASMWPSNKQRPSTGESSSSKNGEGRAEPTRDDNQSRKDRTTVKRTTGIGILNITDLVKAQGTREEQVPIIAPSHGGKSQPQLDEASLAVVSHILPSPGGYRPSRNIQATVLRLRSFVGPDSEAIVRSTPTILQEVHQTRRIGFVRAPTHPRSDIYLTLSKPSLPSNAFLSHPRFGSVAIPQDHNMNDLQLTLEVRNSSGQRLEDCIFPSSNGPGLHAWRTVSVSRGEPWNQTIRLAVRPEDVAGCHIIMSLADACNFPFALCWMPLWTHEAFTRDGEHALVLYKYDEQTSNVIAGKGAYLNLPWNAKGKEELVTGPMATVHTKTFLCSTMYSQDPNLIGLLKWKEQKSRDIVQLLERFQYIPDIEIVKLLPDIFDSLFGTVVAYAGNEAIEDLVFNALVTVVSIVHDRRFNLQPIVDDYAKNKFNFPFAFAPLISAYTRLLSDPISGSGSRKLRTTFKVGSHVLRVIVNARQQQIQKEIGIGIQNHAPTSVKELGPIFKAVEAIMQSQAPILLGTKTLIVQNYHTWLPELRPVMTPQEILTLATEFIDSFTESSGRLIMYRLILIMEISKLDIFADEEAQVKWQKDTERWLHPYWGKNSDYSTQTREQIRLCCSVVSAQSQAFNTGQPDWTQKLVDSYLTIRAMPQPDTEALSLLFPQSYPFPTKPTTSNAFFNEGLIEIAAVLAETRRIHPAWKLKDAASIRGSLQVCKSILDCEAYPTSWISLHVLHHRFILEFLQSVSETLISNFVPAPDDAADFQTELWSEFFVVLLRVLSSSAIALESFPEQKRRAVWKIAGDVRESGAKLLERTWRAIGWENDDEDEAIYGLEAMGGYQVQYVPSLVGPVMELCLSVHEGLRGVAIDILRTMLASEWALSQDLGVIQTEVVSRLDTLFKSKVVNDNIPQQLFASNLLGSFEPQDQGNERRLALYEAVKSLVNVIDKLLDLLLGVYGTSSTGEAFRITDTLRLLEFLRTIEKDDIYIAYVHKLAQIQADAHHATEAGLALKMHADLYTWDVTKNLQAIQEPRFPAQKAFGRKEQIFFQMIKHFEEGEAWQEALSAYQELATQYEHNIYDFSKLARAQRAMASINERLHRGEHQNPRFFRVIFRGLGFPATLRDRQFIYEGQPSDRLSSFSDRMLQQWPSAQINAGSDANEMEGQYLSIHPVGVQRNFDHPINRRPKVSRQLRDYYTLANPQRFSTTPKRQGSTFGKGDTPAERMIFTTTHTFPTILRQSEIIETQTVAVSDVQAALERTARKTHELAHLDARAAEEGETALASLTETLAIFVDAKSSGCVANYWSLVPADPASDGDDDGANADADKTYNGRTALEEALRVALVDHALEIKRCLLLHSRPSQQATRDTLTREFEHSFAPIILAADDISLLPHPSATDTTNVRHSFVPGAAPTAKDIPSLSHLRNGSRAFARNPTALTLPDSSASTKAFTPAATPNPITSPSALASPTAFSPISPVATSSKPLSHGVKVFGTEKVEDKGSHPAFRNNSAAPGFAGGPGGQAPSNNALKPTMTNPSPGVFRNGVTGEQHERKGSGGSGAGAGAGAAIQSRMGSMTKRLSGLGIGRKAAKQALKSPTVDSVAE